MKHKIVLVPFPFDDFSSTKVRPAVCLTDKIDKHNHIVIAFITSQISKDKSESDISLESNDETGLKVKSLMRLHRLTTIPAELIQRSLGQFPKTKEKELKEKLSRLFGI
jgi:mRNA interferase MazF